MPDLSQDQKDLLMRRHEQTMKLRAEFLKQVSNPHRCALDIGGTVFDPAINRFQAMNVSHYEYFKPNFKTFKYLFFLILLPITATGWAFMKQRGDLEAKYRNGEVAYKDRKFKFI